MAWENISITDINSCVIDTQNIFDDSGHSEQTGLYSDGYNYINYPDTSDYENLLNANNTKIQIYKESAFTFKINYNNEDVAGWGAAGTSYRSYIGIGFMVDRENELGVLVVCECASGVYRIHAAPDSNYNNNQYKTYLALTGNEKIQTYTSNGGGATHIAKVTGQLKDLSSHLSDILIVSGGGGGGMLIGDTAYPGADAGGIAGNSDNSADQSTGNAFGLGESGSDVSGGGGGFYGGYKGVAE